MRALSDFFWLRLLVTLGLLYKLSNSIHGKVMGVMFVAAIAIAFGICMPISWLPYFFVAILIATVYTLLYGLFAEHESQFGKGRQDD